MEPYSIVEGELLHYYYKFIFPYELVMRLFDNRIDVYGMAVQAVNREVAIRLREGTGGNPRSFMSRFYSFSNPCLLRPVLLNQLPTCVFIGAGYNSKPSVYKSNGSGWKKQPNLPLSAMPFIPLHREFVLDIDISDYDALRSCCKKRAICQKCWRFMAVACEMIDRVLEQDFGIKHRLWLFSGGRGIHCWCFDHFTLTLNPEQRRFMLECIQEVLSPSGDNSPELKEKMRSSSVVQAYQTALKHVPDILKEQNCFAKPYAQNFLQDYINLHLKGTADGDSVRAEIAAILTTSGDTVDEEQANVSERVYGVLQRAAATCGGAAAALQRVVQRVACPQVDEPVTRELTHLLRCPLSVHTRAACGLVAPFRVAEAARFLHQPWPCLRFRDEVLSARPFLLGEDLGVEGGRYAHWKGILQDMCDALDAEAATIRATALNLNTDQTQTDKTAIKSDNVPITVAPDCNSDVVLLQCNEKTEDVQLSVQMTSDSPDVIVQQQESEETVETATSTSNPQVIATERSKEQEEVIIDVDQHEVLQIDGLMRIFDDSEGDCSYSDSDSDVVYVGVFDSVINNVP